MGKENEKTTGSKIFIIGGNENKSRDTKIAEDFELRNEHVLMNIVNESGGFNSKIIIVPSASDIPDKVAGMYTTFLKSLGATNLFVMDIKERRDASKKENIQRIEEANCIFFTGGKQSNIVEVLLNTPLHQVIKDRLQNNDNFVIAGTSAGAMCMSSVMIAGESENEISQTGCVDLTTGLGLVPSLIIDTHFIERGRFGRLLNATALNPELLGIGIAEDTALVISEGRYNVIGSGVITFIDPSTASNNDVLHFPSGNFSILNVTTHILASGKKFTINNREFKLL